MYSPTTLCGMDALAHLLVVFFGGGAFFVFGFMRRNRDLNLIYFYINHVAPFVYHNYLLPVLLKCFHMDQNVSRCCAPIRVYKQNYKPSTKRLFTFSAAG